MSNLNKFVSETGFLTNEGKLEFEKTLAAPLKEVLALATTEAEVNMLGGVLSHFVADMISTRRFKIKETASKFDAMSDDEFDQYLKNKYGDNYFFVSLTDEEMKRVPRLSKEAIEKAIAEDIENMGEVYSGARPRSDLRFK